MFGLARGSRRLATLLVLGVIAIQATAFTGCDTDEEVLEVETQEGEMEVERNRETGETELETE